MTKHFDVVPPLFVGSRACAANHYVIVEKCGYPEMYVHIFGERRSSEQVPIWVRIYLSDYVGTHTEWLKIDILFTRASICIQDDYSKLKTF